MLIKCAYCGMPFALTQEQAAEAVNLIKKDSRAYYSAQCPKCRRSTKLAKKAFELNPVYKKMLQSQD